MVVSSSTEELHDMVHTGTVVLKPTALKWTPRCQRIYWIHVLCVACLLKEITPFTPEFSGLIIFIFKHLAQVGETGPKLGMNSNDNGFLGFTHHRIPRNHMLMKNSQVLANH